MSEGRRPRTRKVQCTARPRYGRAVRPLLLTLLAALGVSSASAQPRYARVEGDGPAAEALRAEARERGWTPIDDVPNVRPGPTRAALAELSRVEAMVTRAREAATRLREGEALDALAEARALVERHARTPGVARWLAEVELATGVVAHQQGRRALAVQSLGRAASLDPSRRLGAAEAPPPVVSQARELARAAATRPETELAIRSDAPGARAFLDDRPLGRLPVRVEAGVGRHVLRIEAPGHRPWGQVVDLREGRSRPWDVTLSPIDAEARRRRIAAADLASLPDALGEATVLWVTPRDERALVAHCTAAGCLGPAVREPNEAFAPPSGEPQSGARFAAAWAAGLDALGREPLGGDASPPLPRPWWRRGSTWVAVALGAVVAGVALGFSLRPDVRQEAVYVFDTSTFDDL